MTTQPSLSKKLYKTLLYENADIKVEVSGTFTKEELNILEYEVRSTVSSIIKYRIFEGRSISG